VLSCASCHSRRVKCNRGHPCDTCIATGRAQDCMYHSRAPRSKAARRSSGDAAAAGNSTTDSSTSPQVQAIPNYGNSFFDANLQGLDQKNTKPTALDSQFPLSTFFTFVERFQQHTQTNDRDAIIEMAYPDEVVANIDAARNDLPTPDRTRLLILFFFDNLEWTYEAGCWDEMDVWLVPFLDKLNQPLLNTDKLTSGDATKLCLIITILTCTIQCANEGLIQTYFLDSNMSRNELKLDRTTLRDRYDAHVRNLLDSATHQDGSSIELIRSSLIYCHILKNEGRHYEAGNKPFLQSISHLVKQEELHLEPSGAIFSEEQKNSRRRLFWTFYSFDRMTAAHGGFPISIADDQITTQETSLESWSPTLGRRVDIFNIHRSRLCRIGGKMIACLRNDGVYMQAIKAVDDQLMAWQAALPFELQPSLSELPPDLYQLRTLDIQRRVLLIVFNSVRGGVHRLCFFPTDTIDMEQVRNSRKICVESAMNMIKIQEGLRLRLTSEHHLRFFFLPYFMLEAAITLVLTTLIEVGNVPLGNTIPDNINEYIKWSHRALHLLVSLPPDFPPAVQGARLLSRVLTKATQILELHAQRKLTAMDSTSAIRDVLLDDQGRKMPIPLHQASMSSGQSGSTNHTAASDSGNSQSGRTPQSLTSASSFGDLSTGSLPATTSGLIPPKALPDYTKISTQRRKPNAYPPNVSSFQLDPQFTSTSQIQPVEPTYADLGLDFFDTMANSLINPFSSETDGLLIPQQQLPNSFYQPETPSMGMDDQMDVWLASLQTV
jgi:hypothetical protein